MARMTPSEAFVETMVAHGVTEIFGIMGSAFMDAMDIFEPAGIRFISVVHEQGAAHMAFFIHLLRNYGLESLLSIYNRHFINKSFIIFKFLQSPE